MGPEIEVGRKNITNQCQAPIDIEAWLVFQELTTIKTSTDAAIPNACSQLGT